MQGAKPQTPRGPYRVDQLRPDERYELSQGERIYCAPTGADGAKRLTAGVNLLSTDPAVAEVGVDPGYRLDDQTLRAPDIAVGHVPDHPGWIPGVPPLAVEYAGTGQDEAQLDKKISELLEHGTRYVWVVRLVGPRRVEVHEPARPMRVVGAGEELLAPGILRNPVPVAALFDVDQAQELALRNLLQRHGYASLAAVRSEALREGREQGQREGREQGQREGELAALRNALILVMAGRHLGLSEADRDQICSCTDPAVLQRWLARVSAGEPLFG